MDFPEMKGLFSNTKVAVLQKDSFIGKAGVQMKKLPNVGYVTADGKFFLPDWCIENHIDDGYWAWKVEVSEADLKKENEELKRKIEELQKEKEVTPEVVA